MAALPLAFDDERFVDKMAFEVLRGAYANLAAALIEHDPAFAKEALSEARQSVVATLEAFTDDSPGVRTGPTFQAVLKKVHGAMRGLEARPPTEQRSD